MLVNIDQKKKVINNFSTAVCIPGRYSAFFGYVLTILNYDYRIIILRFQSHQTRILSTGLGMRGIGTDCPVIYRVKICFFFKLRVIWKYYILKFKFDRNLFIIFFIHIRPFSSETLVLNNLGGVPRP